MTITNTYSVQVQDVSGWTNCLKHRLSKEDALLSIATFRINYPDSNYRLNSDIDTPAASPMKGATETEKLYVLLDAAMTTMYHKGGKHGERVIQDDAIRAILGVCLPLIISERKDDE